jgi:hypothetical protein
MKPSSERLLLEGLTAGLIGYGAVAGFFLVADPLAGRPLFHTPALLGAALFFGLQDPAALVVRPAPVAAYNGLHCLVFLGLGLLAAWLARLAERAPVGWLLGLNLFLVVLAHLFVAFLIVTEPVRAALPVASAALATLLAVVLMSFFLLAVHPPLRQQFSATAGTD